GAILIAFGRFGFGMSEGICASFLPDCVIDRECVSIVSGIGWGSGYFGGGIVALLLIYTVIMGYEDTDPDFPQRMQYATLLGGCLAAVFFIPAIYGLWHIRHSGEDMRDAESGKLDQSVEMKDSKRRASTLGNQSDGEPRVEGKEEQEEQESEGICATFSSTFKQIFHTIKVVFKNRDLSFYFASFFVFMIGMTGVITFIGVFATDVAGLDSGDLTVMFIIIQTTAALGAFFFSMLEMKIGGKPVVMISLTIWSIGLILVLGSKFYCGWFDWSMKICFLILVPAVGCAMGSLQSSSRSLLAILTPKKLSSEMFALWEFVIAMSSLICYVYGPLADATDSHIIPGCVFGCAFVIGLILMAPVDVNRGKARAKQWQKELMEQSNAVKA
ncbi:Autophagy-related protein 22-like protein, partial [Aduncisulcus paluster]